MNRQQPSRGARFVWQAIAVLVLLVTGTVVIRGYLKGRGETVREAQRDAPIKAPLRVSVGNPNPVITLDSTTLERNGIETASPAPTPYRQQVKAYVSVLDLSSLTDLNNAYVNAHAQLQSVKARLAVSEAEYKRDEQLYRDRQYIPQAELQSAEASYHADESALAAARSQLQTLAASARQEWGPVLGRSIVDGTPMVARLIGRKDFLLQVTLQSGVSLPSAPETATIETGRNMRSTITFVSAATHTDPKIQGVSFFYVVSAASGVLPGMNLLAFLPSGSIVPGVTVPSTAIVWWENRAWVYRRIGPNQFTRVELSTDLPAPGGGLDVKAADLPTSSVIVTQGAQLLLSEEFRAQIQLGKD